MLHLVAVKIFSDENHDSLYTY